MTHSRKNIATQRGLRTLIAVASLLVALALPVSASAQVNLGTGSCDPTDAQYAPPSGSIDCQDINSGGGGGGDTGSSLPLTGMDIVPLAAIAVALGGAGLMLRRLGTGESDRL